MGGGRRGFWPIGHDVLCTSSFPLSLHASILDPISSPPCNNLPMMHIKSSTPGDDWNKVDNTVICNRLFTRILATLETFAGNKTGVPPGRLRLLWDGMEGHQGEIYGSGTGLLIQRDTLRKRWGRGELSRLEDLKRWRGRWGEWKRKKKNEVKEKEGRQ